MCEGDIFYLPGTDEIMRLNFIKDDNPVINNNLVEDIFEDDLKVIREQFCPLPIVKNDYFVHNTEYLWVVDFNQAHSFDSSVLKMLDFYTLIGRILTWEYLIVRVDSTSFDFALEE